MVLGIGAGMRGWARWMARVGYEDVCGTKVGMHGWDGHEVGRLVAVGVLWSGAYRKVSV